MASSQHLSDPNPITTFTRIVSKISEHHKCDIRRHVINLIGAAKENRTEPIGRRIHFIVKHEMKRTFSSFCGIIAVNSCFKITLTMT